MGRGVAGELGDARAGTSLPGLQGTQLLPAPAVGKERPECAGAGPALPEFLPVSRAQVSWLPPFLFSRSGCPSDYHHHCLPHHGHSCSDYNSCLKKLVRLLGPSGLDTGTVGVPREVCTERFLLLRPGPASHPKALFPSSGPENGGQLVALLQPARLQPQGSWTGRRRHPARLGPWAGCAPDRGFPCRRRASPACDTVLGQPVFWSPKPVSASGAPADAALPTRQRPGRARAHPSLPWLCRGRVQPDSFLPPAAAVCLSN